MPQALKESIHRVLKERFGHDRFLPGQYEVIENLLCGRDVLAIMPTGGGKSLCYQVPALLLPGITIVVSPLISLMKDQVDKLTARGIPAALINSTLRREDAGHNLERARGGELRLLYIAPERFRSESFREALEGMRVSLFAVDEAHCISQWGHDFRPAYLKLRHAIRLCGHPVVGAFTATATPEVRRDISEQMGLIRPRVLVRGFDRPNLKYLTLRLKEREKKNETVDIIRKLSAPTIVYCATKRITSRLAEQLRDEGIPCAAYHAGLDKHARTRIQNRFFEGSLPVIVATNAFGMGIDKPDIRLLIHYNMPGSVEAFYQESGRAGRDGKPAYSLLFGNRHDTAIQHYLIAQSFPTEEIVRAVYRFLLDFPANPVLLTYREIARELPRRAGEIVIGNALKVLESHRLIRRLSEKQHPATVGFAVPIERIIQRHRRYPGRKRILDEFLRRFPDAGAGATRCFSLPALCRAAGQSREQVNRNLRALARSKDLVYVPPFSGRGIEKIEQLPNDPAPAVDFDRLEANRRRQLAKVARMEEYLGAASCKRHFLLRYFGESPEKARCGACDVCLGWRASNRRTPSNFPSDKRNAPVAPRRRALAKTAETLSGEEERLFYCGVLKYNRKLGLLPFLRLLCGSRERAILSRGLDRCSFYAALGDSSLGRLNRFFLHEKKSGNLTRTRSRRFPKIALTDKGMEKARLLLKGLSGGSHAGGGLEAESACQSR